jgi:hypothetical protein
MRTKWVGRHLVHMRETRSARKILFGQHERKKPPGRYRHRRGDNIEVGLKEMCSEDVAFMPVVQNKV